MGNRKPISVTFDTNVLAEVDRLCDETDRTRSWFVERAVLLYINEIVELEEALSNAGDPPGHFVTEEELIGDLGL